MSVYRDSVDDKLEIHCQKAKFKHLGQIGNEECKYNINNGRFTDILQGIPFWDNDNWLLKKSKVNEYPEFWDK
jgi:hypothetical protein